MIGNIHDLPKIKTAAPENNFISFNWEAIKNDAASVSQVVYDKVLYIYIFIPGERDFVKHEVRREFFDGRVRKNDLMYKRFGDHIATFDANESATVSSGMPIEQWPLIDVTRAAHLRHLGIYSVEALAEMPDGTIGKVGPGGRDLQRKAKDWLKSASDANAAMKATENYRQLETRFDELQQQFVDFAEVANALPEPHKTDFKAELARKSAGRGKGGAKARAA